MTGEETIIALQGIKKDYEIKSMQEEKVQKVKVLKGIDMTVKSGEYVAIMGRSGSGKTTLLKILGLILRPDGGTVSFREKDIQSMWKDELADIRRRKMGFIFQNFELIDSLSVLDNIMLPAIIDKRPLDEAKEKARVLAVRLDLKDELLGKAPYELSGGERQRVAICRALINDPELILADEPTGNLDEKSGNIVSDILTDINANMGKTIILVTHNPKLAGTSKRLYMIKDGIISETLEQQGNSDTYYREILERM